MVLYFHDDSEKVKSKERKLLLEMHPKFTKTWRKKNNFNIFYDTFIVKLDVTYNTYCDPAFLILVDGMLRSEMGQNHRKGFLVFCP